MDEAQSLQKYDLTTINIISSTQISKATTRILKTLAQNSKDNKHPIVALTAKARVANKLISIVEIAKRDSASRKGALYQYTALSSEMVEISAKNADSKGDQGEESDDAFEAVAASDVPATKMREMPVLTIYLSTVSIKELKIAHG